MPDEPQSEKLYKKEFYSKRHQRTLAAAGAVLGIVREAIPSIDSAVDLGCGVGTWLAHLAEQGTATVRGFDGPWVDESLLEIPRERFTEADLNTPVEDTARYDLAMSLEVAEHLKPESAATFVASLTSLSDFVLFGAAIPGQRGAGHINEQWPGYWAALFAERGFHPHDIIRGRIWDDANIPVWYRQNTLLYVAEARASEVALSPRAPLDIVHPESFARVHDRLHHPSLGRALEGVVKSFRKRPTD